MKVVQINSSCKTGSTGRICEGISRLLSEQNIDNRIYYSGYKVVDYSLGYVINNKLDLRIHQVMSFLFGDQGWHSTRATKKLIESIKSYNPDIIHLHNLHGFYLNLSVLFNGLSELNKPIVWTLHDCWAFTGHCTHYTSVQCKKWKTHCTKCPQKRMYPYSLLFDRSNALFDRKKDLYKDIKKMYITTVSNWLALQVEQSMLLRKYPRSVIPNGIDNGVFYPRSPLSEIAGVRVDSRKILLGVASSWGERKGLSTFLQVSKRLRSSWMIVLVGLSEKQIESLPENIVGIRRTDSIDALAAIYSTATIFLNASEEETFGLTTIEAMACGTPAIVYNSTACPEPVINGMGYIVEPKDINSIMEILDSVDSIKIDKDKYINHIKDNYLSRDIYAKYIDLYRSVISGGE